MRPRCLGQETDHDVHILDVVDHAAVWVAEAIVDRLVVGIALCGRYLLRLIATMLPVDFAQRLHQLLLLGAIGETCRRPPIDEIIEAGQLPQADLTAELVEPRDTALAVADQIERGDIDLAVHAGAEIEVLQELRVIA